MRGARALLASGSITSGLKCERRRRSRLRKTVCLIMVEQGVIGRDDAIILIDAQISAHADGILAALAPFDAASAIATWHGTIRDIEEFINVLMNGIDDDELLASLAVLPLGDVLAANPQAAIAARNMLAPLFGPDLARRFMITMLRITRADVGLRASGRSLAAGFTLNVVGEAAGFFQSRRRHYVSLLYLMADACKGKKKFEPEHAFDVLLPVVEYCCISFTGWNWKGVLAEIFREFTLTSDGVGSYASHEYDPLESAFLEPETVGLLEMYTQRGDQVGSHYRERQDATKIFSAPELRNGVRLIQAAYECFGLNDREFSILARMASAFSRYCEQDYFIRIGTTRFQAMLRAQNVFDPVELEQMLVNRANDFAVASNSFEPFIETGGYVVSNVNLLTRFLNAFKNIHLGSRKRFQIHAGFIFEDMVAADLADYGFTVTDITRINRQEFDVVTVLGDVIHNFQCKNNWIDLGKLESNRRLLARYNRRLDRYYRSALRKEAGREDLLLGKLGLSRIEHHVISRFPVITEAPRIINYNRLEECAASIIASADKASTMRRSPTT